MNDLDFFRGRLGSYQPLHHICRRISWKSESEYTTGNFRSGIPGNSQESGIIKIPGGNFREFRKFNFYPRHAMLARVFAIATCLSVRQSVCLSRAGIVSKRRNVMISSPFGSSTILVFYTTTTTTTTTTSQGAGQASMPLRKNLTKDYK